MENIQMKILTKLNDLNVRKFVPVIGEKKQKNFSIIETPQIEIQTKLNHFIYRNLIPVMGGGRTGILNYGNASDKFYDKIK